MPLLTKAVASTDLAAAFFCAPNTFSRWRRKILAGQQNVSKPTEHQKSVINGPSQATARMMQHISTTTAHIGPGDESTLREFLYHAIFVPDGEKPLERNVLELPEISRYMNDWGRDGDFGLKVLQNSQAIGAIWCRFFTATKPGYGYVSGEIPELTMSILPEYRNRGLGMRLYRDFEELLIRQQIRGLSLSVDKRNPATRFYLRAGFKVIREEKTALVMIRHISKTFPLHSL